LLQAHADPYNALISKRLVLRLDAGLFGSSCGIVPAARIAILANASMRAPSPSAPQDCMSGFST
jgi:hypothetical protein